MKELGDALPYLLSLAVLVTASAFFSGTEVAMFSLRRVDRQRMARSGRRSDSMIVRMLARPRKLIATLLIGNELVNVSVSAVVASITPFLIPGGTELQLTFVATFFAVTLLLLLGEITPKTIAIKTSVGWSTKSVRPLWLFYVLVTPVRFVVHGIANLIMKPFGGSMLSSGPRDLSEDEFKALVDAGSAHGELDPHERRLIHRVFEFGDKTVAEVISPRKKIFALAYDLPTVRLIREIAAGGYSRVPIYQKSLDKILGVVYAKDLVIQGTGLAPPRRLVDLLHEPLFVPHTIPIERLFRYFKQRNIHMAIVVNEYGKVVGLVTMEDLLEELFGEIADEREQQKASVARTPRGRTTTPAPIASHAVDSAPTDPNDHAGGKS